MHATEMKTKRHYTAPVTQRATVELEGGFCGSIANGSTKIKATEHTTGFEGTWKQTDEGVGDDANFGISWE